MTFYKAFLADVVSTVRVRFRFVDEMWKDSGPQTGADLTGLQHHRLPVTEAAPAMRMDYYAITSLCKRGLSRESCLASEEHQRTQSSPVMES